MKTNAASNPSYQWLAEIKNKEQLKNLFDKTLKHPNLPQHAAMRQLLKEKLYEIRLDCLSKDAGRAFVFVCLKFGRKLSDNATYTSREVLLEMSKHPESVIALIYRDYATYEQFLHKPKSVTLTLSYDDENAIDDFYAPFERAQRQYEDEKCNRKTNILAQSATTTWVKKVEPKLWEAVLNVYAANHKYPIVQTKIGGTSTEGSYIYRFVDRKYHAQVIPPLEKVCYVCGYTVPEEYAEKSFIPKYRIPRDSNQVLNVRDPRFHKYQNNEIVLFCHDCHHRSLACVTSPDEIRKRHLEP